MWPELEALFAPIYTALGYIPLESLEPRFMRQALLAVLLLSPLTAILGVQVLNFRMAFFSDAIGHSAFAGVAVGLMLALPPRLAMPLFGLLVGLLVMAVQRKSGLSADSAIGIVFSAVVAFGLAAVSRASGLAREMQQYLYGDILTVSELELFLLGLLLICVIIFELLGWNRLMDIALSPVRARVQGIRLAFWQYCFAALLALNVMFSVWAVGVLLVTALLIVPAACARNLARSAAAMFWWALLVGMSSGICGLLLSAQDWLGTASGATIILAACVWFAASCAWRFWRRD